MEKDKLIEIKQINDCEYQFKIKGLSVELKVLVYKSTEDDFRDVRFELSHYIHTPLNDTHYVPSHPYGKNKKHAIQRAISSYEMNLKTAIKAGHTAHNSWFIFNREYLNKQLLHMSAISDKKL